MSEAEDRIIQATVDCIERYGLEKTTIRRIGAQAGVNSAAVNYYFRSKDALLARVFDATLDNAFNWDDFAYTEGMPLKEQLCEIFSFFAVSAMKFRNITQVHMTGAMAGGGRETLLAEKLDVFLEKVLTEVQRKKPGLSQAEGRLLLTQLIAGTLPYFSVCATLFDGFSGWDMTREAARAAYVERLVDALL